MSCGWNTWQDWKKKKNGCAMDNKLETPLTSPQSRLPPCQTGWLRSRRRWSSAALPPDTDKKKFPLIDCGPQVWKYYPNYAPQRGSSRRVNQFTAGKLVTRKTARAARWRRLFTAQYITPIVLTQFLRRCLFTAIDENAGFCLDDFFFDSVAVLFWVCLCLVWVSVSPSVVGQ